MQNNERFRSRFRRFGLLLAGAFFAVSAVFALRNQGGTGKFASGVPTITIAHWQLEDGFREGLDEAIRIYETEKAAQGIKVKVRQTAIPVRGYAQWFLTQLIGGEPADLMEMLGSSDIHNRYFEPLSAYIGALNVWNRGTPLEAYSWRESYADDMLSSLDSSYSEFFGISIFLYTSRVYVNMELYRRACGSRPLPATMSEWAEACRLLRAYGERVGMPVIPIGVRGFDKGTLGELLNSCNSQLNADLADTGSPYDAAALPGELFRQINAGTLKKERLLEPVRAVTELGRYFAAGFPAIDLEQTKYLFNAGSVGFFIDGTYNAWSMVNNSPFPVEVIRLPVLDGGHGEITELGSGIGGRFGITRKSKHFELALDFLQFLTSYRISQLTMVEHCKWLSPLKGIEYEGLMKKFEPVSNTAYMPIDIPFETGGYGRLKMLQYVESGILEDVSDPGKSFWNRFVGEKEPIIDELQESVGGTLRTLWSMSGSASALRIGAADAELSVPERALYRTRGSINCEGMAGRLRMLDAQQLLIREIGKLRKEP